MTSIDYVSVQFPLGLSISPSLYMRGMANDSARICGDLDFTFSFLL